VVAPEGFGSSILEALLDVVQARSGTRPQLHQDSRFDNPAVPFGDHFAYLLFEHKVFQQALLNPVVLTLVTHLLGENAVLSNCLAFIKGPGNEDLGLHCDNVYIPAPFPAHAQVCNATWLLTDYDKDDGALCFVPGSHQYGRHPNPTEGLDARVAIEAPAFSLAFWHGNTWHGAFARTNPGLRVNLINAFMRMYMRPQEPYRENVTAEQLARHPERFATLLGQHVGYGWKEEGPDYDTLGAHAGKGQSRWY
jgi:ectoine hydroxylase-related dioxygenase (phytanoyl-CoA dioxygenase family)